MDVTPHRRRPHGPRGPRGRSTTASLVAATLLVSGLLVSSGGGAATAELRAAGSAPGSSGSSGSSKGTATGSPAGPTTAPPATEATTAGPTPSPTRTSTPRPPRTTAAPAPTASAPTPSPTRPVGAVPTVAPPSVPTATATTATTAPTAPAPGPTPAPTAAPTVAPTAAPTTGPTSAPSAAPSPLPSLAGARTTLPLPRSTWTRPTLVDPIVWRPSVTNTVLRNAGDRDVLVVWPDTPLDVEGGFQINGGRNVLSVGGTIQPSRRYFALGETTPNDNRCLYIGGATTAKAPRTVHVEGLHCAGSFVWEGINIDSKAERGTLTVQLRDVRIDQVNVDLPGGMGNHYGGDALQTWNGPHQLRIDGFTAKKLHYQGLFLQPFAYGSGTVGRWDLRNLQLEGSTTGSAYLLWLADSAATPLSYGFEGVFVQPSPGDSRTTTIWHSSTDFTAAVLGAPVEDIVGHTHVGPFAAKP